MSLAIPVDDEMPSRELIRTLRAGVQRSDDIMPESVLWHTWLALHRRGVPEARDLFIGALRNLHARRSMAGASLPVNDRHTEEHRMVDDPMLGELWKAYKKCIRNNRNGPAGEILKEIETRIVV